MEVLSIKENYKDDEITNIDIELELTKEDNRCLIQYAVINILEDFIEKNKEKNVEHQKCLKELGHGCDCGCELGDK